MIMPGIIDRVHKRRERWEHIEDEALPPVEWIDEVCFVGSFSIAALKTRRRFLKMPVCLRVDGHVETPTALARDYLAVKYGRGPGIKHEQFISIEAGMVEIPLYAKPVKFDRGFYIDIQSCYWSIMNIVGWDVDYWPRKWLSVGEKPADFPWPKHKIARNCLVSSGLLSNPPMWSPEKGYFAGKAGNRFANMQLFRLITDILRSIAWRAVKAGAVYVNNDGYIAPNRKIATVIADIIRDWGLEPGIKGHGSGGVIGVGDYIVGRMRSKRSGLVGSTIDNLEPVKYEGWLQRQFSYHAAQAGAE